MQRVSRVQLALQLDDIRIMKAIFPHQQVIVGDIKVETILVANLISFKARTIRLGTQRISIR